MKIDFVNHEAIPRISMEKIPVYRVGTVQALTLYCAYEMKDLAKDWAKSFDGGNWHPVLKCWYVPIPKGIDAQKEIIASLLDTGIFKGMVNIYIDSRLPKEKQEKLKIKWRNYIPKSKPIPEEVVFGIHEVGPDDPLYNPDPTWVFDGIEISQAQGFVMLKNGKKQRVLVSHYEKKTEDDLFGGYWRQFKDELGIDCWAFPWEEPRLRCPGTWDDWTPGDSIEEEPPKKKREPNLKISLVCDKDNKPLSLAVIFISKKEKWDTMYGFCKKFGTWDAEKKRWLIKPESLNHRPGWHTSPRFQCLDVLVDFLNDGFSDDAGRERIYAELTEKAREYLSSLKGEYYIENTEEAEN